jgi:hypothetical protein
MRTPLLLLLLMAPLGAAAEDVSSASVSAQVTVTAQSVKKRNFNLSDPAQDLRAAERAISRGGGAEAYADRGAAKRALGRPFEDYIVDYAAAAKLDPQYRERFEGIIEQRESQIRREKKLRGVQADHDANGLAKALGSVAIGGLVFLAALILLEGRKSPL